MPGRNKVDLTDVRRVTATELETAAEVAPTDVLRIKAQIRETSSPTFAALLDAEPIRTGQRRSARRGASE